MGVAGGGLHTLVGCLAASMVVGVRLSGVEDSCLDSHSIHSPIIHAELK